MLDTIPFDNITEHFPKMLNKIACVFAAHPMNIEIYLYGDEEEGYYLSLRYNDHYLNNISIFNTSQYLNGKFTRHSTKQEAIDYLDDYLNKQIQKRIKKLENILNGNEEENT